jgi:hypothetical protein
MTHYQIKGETCRLTERHFSSMHLFKHFVEGMHSNTKEMDVQMAG